MMYWIMHITKSKIRLRFGQVVAHRALWAKVLHQNLSGTLFALAQTLDYQRRDNDCTFPIGTVGTVLVDWRQTNQITVLWYYNNRMSPTFETILG
jgi:hypothetical protein